MIPFFFLRGMPAGFTGGVGKIGLEADGYAIGGSADHSPGVADEGAEVEVVWNAKWAVGHPKRREAVQLELADFLAPAVVADGVPGRWQNHKA